MDKIHIDTAILCDYGQRIAKISKELTDIRRELSGLHLSREGGAYVKVDGMTVQSSIGINCRNLEKISQRTGKLSKAVVQASSSFEKAEHDLLGYISIKFNIMQSNHGSVYFSVLIDALGYPKDTSTWSTTMFDKYDSLLKNTTYTKDSLGRDVYITYKDGQQLDIYTIDPDGRHVSTNSMGVDGLRLFYEKENRHGEGMSKNRFEIGFESSEFDDINIREPGYKDKDREFSSKEDPGDWKNVGMLAGFSISSESKNSLFQRDGKYENSMFSANGEVRVGNLDGQASFKGGLFITKTGPDGKEKYVLSPGVEAKVGVSASLFEASGSARFGSELNNIKVEGEIKALSAEAKGDVAIGIVDGKFAAKAGVSMEANLISATASGSVSVAGIEAKGSVTAKVGVGFKANVGYKDGVVSADIGASLGLGVSVKFEVDVGKAVNNAGKAVEKAGKAIWNLLM